MQPFHDFAEQHCREREKHAARKKNRRKPRLDGNDHCKRADQPNRHTEHPRKDIHISVCHDDRIVGQAVHPFAGVHRIDTQVILFEKRPCEPRLKCVFDARFAQLCQPANDGAQRKLCRKQRNRKPEVLPESRRILRNGIINQLPQQKRV